MPKNKPTGLQLANREKLEIARTGHILEKTELIGLYGKNGL